ncbi:MAG: hypothetical protein COB13_004025 [OCS116 cluster bacterium]|nr:hypothetical protein [OCS116 cluster bacterium]
MMGLILAFLLFATGCIHHFRGGGSIWAPMLVQWQDVKQKKLVKGTLGFIWHGVTLWFIGMTGLALYAYVTPHIAQGIYLSLAIQNLSFAIIASLYGKLVYGRFLASPQWLFFWPIAVAAFVAYSGAM